MRLPEPIRVMYGHLHWRALVVLWLTTAIGTAYVVVTDAPVLVAAILAGIVAGGLTAVFLCSALEGAAECDGRATGPAKR